MFLGSFLSVVFVSYGSNRNKYFELFTSKMFEIFKKRPLSNIGILGVYSVYCGGCTIQKLSCKDVAHFKNLGLYFKIESGIVYGLITCLSDGYGIATYPMEYLVAFGSIAFFGFVSPFLINNFGKSLNGKLFSILLLLCATVIWSTIRFFAASFDSVVLYEYTWAAAFGYNVTYVFPSAALDLVLLSLLLVIVFPIFKIYKTTFYEEVINKSNPMEVEIETLEESSTPAEEELPVEENNKNE